MNGLNNAYLSTDAPKNINTPITRPKGWKFIISDWDKANFTQEELEWLEHLFDKAKTKNDHDYLYELTEQIRNKYRIKGIISDDGYGNTIIDPDKMQKYIENGGAFFSETAAVYAFGYVYLPLSKKNEIEYGAAIHINYFNIYGPLQYPEQYQNYYTMTVVPEEEISVKKLGSAAKTDRSAEDNNKRVKKR